MCVRFRVRFCSKRNTNPHFDGRFDGSIVDDFEFGKTLGTGSFGRVRWVGCSLSNMFFVFVVVSVIDCWSVAAICPQNGTLAN